MELYCPTYALLRNSGGLAGNRSCILGSFPPHLCLVEAQAHELVLENIMIVALMDSLQLRSRKVRT